LNEKTILITNEKNWLEHTAIKQLDTLAELEGVTQVVGLPDLHAGKTPVGLALMTENRIYPHIIGNDIGCGMALFKTGLEERKLKLERWVTKLNHIRELSDIETVNPYDDDSPIYDLGTIGGGNHFAEFQLINEIHNEDEFLKLGMSKKEVYLLIHSGSRGYGQSILSEFLDFGGFSADSEKGFAYFEKHNDALKWAARNREIVADKLLNYLGYSKEMIKIIDCFHNFLERANGLYIHRKGAVSSQHGAVVIPGSRGTLTYIVKPKNSRWLSLSHGAGRKWARSLCKSRIREKYDRDTIRQNKYKGRVVCHNTDLLFEEAPEAYKNIDMVIDSLLQFDLIEIIATLKPVLTYKG